MEKQCDIKTIREWRTGLSIGQKELSERLGITQAALSHYERGRRKPEYPIALKIADVFGCSLNEIDFIEHRNVVVGCTHNGKKMCMKCGKVLKKG